MQYDTWGKVVMALKPVYLSFLNLLMQIKQIKFTLLFCIVIGLASNN